jgi:hypothetical protein
MKNKKDYNSVTQADNNPSINESLSNIEVVNTILLGTGE